MKTEFNQVYQFKISLKGVRPPIWREIQVPETYTFWDFHVAIQDAMGWQDYHLHEFELLKPSTDSKVNIGIPDEDFGRKVFPGWTQKIADYFSSENRAASYLYDFGDDWGHQIELQKIIPKKRGVSYPVCSNGKRACPPEDCGGIWGYEDLLEIIKDPTHEEYEEMMEWLGGEFDPEHFEAKKVRFDDPEVRRQIAFG
ncbi:MAG: plasmid pRiA4b ORF-3 family protein [bacterium]